MSTFMSRNEIRILLVCTESCLDFQYFFLVTQWKSQLDVYDECAGYVYLLVLLFPLVLFVGPD